MTARTPAKRAPRKPATTAVAEGNPNPPEFDATPGLVAERKYDADGKQRKGTSYRDAAPTPGDEK